MSPTGGPGGRRQPHGHRHGHRHGGGHGSVPGGAARTLAAVLAVTLVVLAVEVVGAVVSGSLALLADAGHMLTDAAGLSLALVAAVLVRRPPTDRLTWGYRRAEVLAAAAQAAVLLAVGVFLLVEGVRRLVEPPAVAPAAMVVFGVLGLAGNAACIALLARARSGGGADGHAGADLNLRAAFLEVVNDALGSAAVLVAAAVVAVTGWLRADAVASLLIAVLILPRTWTLLRRTVDVLLEATPDGVDLAEVRSHLLGVPHVRGVHDVHASTVATGLPVLTAHVVVDDACFHDGHLTRMLDELQGCLAGHFDVEHSTFQFESAAHADHEHPTHA